MSASLSLKACLQKLGSDRQKDRDGAVDSLKFLLQDPAALSKLKDDKWAMVLNTFIQLMKREKELYDSKAQQSSATATAIAKQSARIVESAKLFRSFVEAGADHLSQCHKDIIAHFLMVVPSQRDRYFQPLALEYLKILRVVMSNTHYCQNLSRQHIRQLFQFCISVLIRKVDAMDVDEDEDDNNNTTSIDNRRFSPSNPVFIETSRMVSKLVIYFSDLSKDYVTHLIGFFSKFLKTYPFESECHAHILAALNYFLLETATPNHLDDVYNFFTDAFPSVIGLWDSSKNKRLKTHIILFCRLYTKVHAIHVAALEEQGWELDATFDDHVRIMASKCISDWSSRHGIGLLSWQHIEFSKHTDFRIKGPRVTATGCCSSSATVLSSRVFDKWAMTDLTSDLYAHLLRRDAAIANADNSHDNDDDDSGSNMTTSDHQGAENRVEVNVGGKSSRRQSSVPLDERPSKKVKKMDTFSELMDALSSMNTGTTAAVSRLGTIQSLALLFSKLAHQTKLPITNEQATSLLQKLTDLLNNDDDLEIQSWCSYLLSMLLRHFPGIIADKTLLQRLFAIAAHKTSMLDNIAVFHLIQVFIDLYSPTSSTSETNNSLPKSQLLPGILEIVKSCLPGITNPSPGATILIISLARKSLISVIQDIESPYIDDQKGLVYISGANCLKWLCSCLDNATVFVGYELAWSRAFVLFVCGVKSMLALSSFVDQVGGLEQDCCLTEEYVVEQRVGEFEKLLEFLVCGEMAWMKKGGDLKSGANTNHHHHEKVLSDEKRTACLNAISQVLKTHVMNGLTKNTTLTSHASLIATISTTTMLVEVLYSVSSDTEELRKTHPYIIKSLNELLNIITTTLDQISKNDGVFTGMVMNALSRLFGLYRSANLHVWQLSSSSLDLSFTLPSSNSPTASSLSRFSYLPTMINQETLKRLIDALSNGIWSQSDEKPNTTTSRRLTQTRLKRFDIDDDDDDDAVYHSSSQKSLTQVPGGNGFNYNSSNTAGLFAEAFGVGNNLDVVESKTGIVEWLVQFSGMLARIASPADISDPDSLIGGLDHDLMDIVYSDNDHFTDIIGLFAQWTVLNHHRFEIQKSADILKSCTDVLEDFRYQKNKWVLKSVLIIVGALFKTVEKSLKESSAGGDKLARQELMNQLWRCYIWFIGQAKKNRIDWGVRVDVVKMMTSILNIQRSFPVQEEEFVPSNAILDFIWDEDLRTRLVASEAMTKLFKLNRRVVKENDVWKKLEDKLHHVLEQTEVSYEQKLTTLVMLADVFYHSSADRSSVFYEICSLAKDDENLAHVIQAIGRATIQELIPDCDDTKGWYVVWNDLASSVLHRWLGEHSVFDFPVAVVGFSDISLFLNHVFDTLIPLLVARNQLDQVALIAKKMKGEPKTLLKKSLSQILSFLLPLMFRPSSSSKKTNTANDTMTKIMEIIGADEFQEEFSRAFEKSVVYLLLNVKDDMNHYVDVLGGDRADLRDTLIKMASLPEGLELDKDKQISSTGSLVYNRDLLFDGSDVRASLNHMLSLRKIVSIDNLLVPITLQKTLHVFHEIFSKAQFAERRRQVFHAYRFILAACGDHLYHPFIYRLVLQMLCKLIGTNEFVEDVIPVIWLMCERGLAKQETILEKNVAWVVSTLVEQMTASTSSSSSNDLILGAIQFIADKMLDTTASPITTLTMVQLLHNDAVTPRLSTSLRHQMTAVVSASSREVVFKDILPSFQTLSAAKKLAALRYLRRCLSEMSVDALWSMEDLIVSLLNKGLSDASDAVVIETGRCLGYIGPFLRLDKLLVQSGESNASNLTTTIFQYLTEYCFDANVKSSAIAIRTVRSILFSRSGNEALENYTLPWDVQQYLTFLKPNISRPKDVRPKNKYPPLNDLDIWKSCGKSYNQWVVTLANSLLTNTQTNDVLCQLGLIIEDKPAFAQVVLPHIIHVALLTEMKSTDNTLKTLLSKCMKTFFENASNELKSAVVCLLNVVTFLRKQSLPNAATPFMDNFWLDVDYLSCCKAAIQCGAYATALAFAEIWAETQKTEAMAIPTAALNESSQVLMQIFRNMDDPDGLYGVFRLVNDWNTDMLVCRYEHEGNWIKYLNKYETELQRGEGPQLPARVGLVKSMSRLGYRHVVDMYVSSLRGWEEVDGEMPSDLAEQYYESQWKGSKWSLHSNSINDMSKSGQHQRIYACLQSLASKNTDLCLSNIDASILASCRDIRMTSLDGAPQLSGAICKLVLFTEIEEVSKSDNNHMKSFLNTWRVRSDSLAKRYSFEEMKDVLECRTALMNIVSKSISKMENANGETSGKEDFLRFYSTHLLNTARSARKSGSFHECELNLARVEGLLKSSDIPNDNSSKSKFELAKLLWSQKDQSVAIDYMKNWLCTLMSSKGINFKPDRQFAKMMSKLGCWVAQLRSEKPTAILEQYFRPAVNIVQTSPRCHGDETDYCGVFFNLARYADEQYMELCQDDILSVTQELKAYKEAELRACNDLLGKATSTTEKHNLEVQRRRVEATLEMDRVEYDLMMQAKSVFLLTAVENYMKTLASGHQHDMCIFRLISLWFGNAEDSSVNKKIVKYLDQVESWKFLTLIYQISARLSNDEGVFQQSLNLLIEKMVIEHPYHTLFQIIALKNGGNQSSSSTKRKKSDMNAHDEKSLAASKLLSKLAKKNSRMATIITDMDRLSSAYIELSNTPVDSNNDRKTGKRNLKEPIKMDKTQIRLASLGNLTNIPVPTYNLPIDRTKKYDTANLIYVKEFKPYFRVVGGINLPKIIQCVGSDGKSYTQLVKGQDDLRQDAVLSKIFYIVDSLLKKNLSTRQRNLGIRTYKVIPLAPRSGILEWVENTCPIGEWLLDAHARYNGKTDLPPLDCRRKMHREHERKESNPKSKYIVYREIASRFKPVFRHFFWELFKDPVEWYHRRLAYTRSVASSSIVGFIVGLGDRHAQNILIDKKTAEVVHIDLGIAFDHGKLLSTPELVPFRLTRDMVDGMGITGVEGVFRRCCQEVLQVLRDERNIVITVAEVLRYDPLYHWKLSPLKSRKYTENLVVEQGSVTANTNTVSNTNDTGGNKEAERALVGVQKKLSDKLSIECAVNELIETARSEELLARMFPGWQPWL